MKTFMRCNAHGSSSLFLYEESQIITVLQSLKTELQMGSHLTNMTVHTCISDSYIAIAW